MSLDLYITSPVPASSHHSWPLASLSNSYLLEDWLHFCGTFSAYVFKDALSPELKEMWDLLCIAVDHYFRPVDHKSHDSFLAASRKASDALRKFARLAEQRNFPARTFTINLHMCVCRLVSRRAWLALAGIVCLDGMYLCLEGPM